MILCQNCKTPNNASRQNCSRCGTRLMMITVRGMNQDSALGNTLEEHLLERISMLEYLLSRMQERFERLLDLMHRHATSSFSQQALVDALVAMLVEDEFIDKDRLEAAWQTRMSEQVDHNQNREILEARKEKILAGPQGENPSLFLKYMLDGVEQFIQGHARRGVRLLEKASLLAPDNVELQFFLGEYFYYHEKLALAESYLIKTVTLDPKHYSALLILAIICGDDGKVEDSKEYFEHALIINKDSFTAHYGLGQIFASEGKMEKALPHFKRALLLKPSPEMYYLVGQAYLATGHAETALKHLSKAVELDPKFDAALYHLGVIYLQQNLVDKARELFRAAYEINPIARYKTALKARPGASLPSFLSFGRTTISRRGVLTQGDVRLAKLLRNSLIN